jgi:hypothetical protein
MKLGRILILTLLVLLGSGWLQAETDSHFFISLNIDGSDCFNGIIPGTNETCSEDGQQGWGAVIGGQLQGTITNEAPEELSFGESVTCYTDRQGNFKCRENDDDSWDPSAGTRLGGKSTPITQSFVVPIDGNGGGATDFQDTLGPITGIQLVGVFPKSAFPLTFTCDPGNAFDFCGFNFVDPSDTVTVTASFFNTPGDVHIDSVPEPSTWLLLGTAALAILGRRTLRRA